MKLEAIRKVLNNYNKIIISLDEFSETGNSEQRLKCIGFCSILQKENTYASLSIAYDIFNILERVIKSIIQLP